MSSLQIIPSSQIDPVKWNRCVQQDPCGLIYSRYEFLQHICDHWSGMIWNDYACVMALPFRKKWGIRYVYHPAFIQQTGLIGQVPADWPSRIKPAILRHFSYGDIPFHFGNRSTAIPSKERVNFVLDLHHPYPDIARQYRQDLKQSLNHAGSLPLQYKAIPVEKGADFYRDTYQHRSFLKEKDHIRFRQLCRILFMQDACMARCVYDNNNLLAAAVLLKDDKRIYLIANSVSMKGREYRANHWLLDAVIREFAETGLLFDFEGSEIPGVSAFYRSFGAISQPYYYWHFNELPWPLRLWR